MYGRTVLISVIQFHVTDNQCCPIPCQYITIAKMMQWQGGPDPMMYVKCNWMHGNDFYVLLSSYSQIYIISFNFFPSLCLHMVALSRAR